jgi:hypothetical protein
MTDAWDGRPPGEAAQRDGWCWVRRDPMPAPSPGSEPHDSWIDGEWVCAAREAAAWCAGRDAAAMLMGSRGCDLPQRLWQDDECVKAWAGAVDASRALTPPADLSAALSALLAEARREGVLAAAEIVEGGRFLHAEAPAARLAKLAAAAIRAAAKGDDA